MKDRLASLGLTCGQHVESPMRCWRSRLELLIKLVATQIPYDTRLTLIRPAGDRTRDRSLQVRVSGSFIYICIFPGKNKFIFYLFEITIFDYLSSWNTSRKKMFFFLLIEASY